MTWVKLSDGFNDDPNLLRVSRGARLLYIEGLVYSAKHLLDGQLPAVALPRFSDEPAPHVVAQQLVDAGLWESTDDGWRVINYHADQESKAQVDRRRDQEKLRKERSRRHREGDHTLCVRGRYCPDGDLAHDGTRDTTRDSTRAGTDNGRVTGRLPASARPDPSRPVPTEGQGKGGSEQAAAAAHALTRCPHGKPETSYCAQCVPSSREVA